MKNKNMNYSLHQLDRNATRKFLYKFLLKQVSGKKSWLKQQKYNFQKEKQNI